MIKNLLHKKNKTFTLYTHTMDTWDAFYDSCKKAEKSIYIEMFIFWDNTEETHDFVSLFCEKARSGLHVVLLLDAFGSRKLSRKTTQRLRESGVEVRFFIKWFSFTHRKLIIIDDKQTFLGGVNIKRRHHTWVDLAIKIENKHVIEHLSAMFARAYQLSGGVDQRILSHLILPKLKPISVQIIEQFPALGYFKFKQHVEQKLDEVKNSVVIATPYFAPPKWLEKKLLSLLGKNISLTIILPRRTDSFFLKRMNKLYASLLVKKGAKVFLLDYMNHAKAMLVDDREGMIGSGNMDNLSFNINSEIGVFFSDDDAVSELKEILLKWRSEGIVYIPEEHGLRWYEKLLMPFLYILWPIL